MEKTLEEFLGTFRSNVAECFNGKTFGFADFKNAFDSNKISLSRPKHFLVDERVDMPWLKEFLKVMSNIFTIVGDPRNHLFVYKDVKKAEQASKIDNQDIVETSKVSSFWSLNREDEPSPIKVYTDIHEIEYAIYENRFIVHLIDMMIEWIDAVTKDVNTLVRYIGQNFLDGIASMADSEAIEEIAKFNRFFNDGTKQVKREMPLLTGSDAYYIQQLKSLYRLKADLSMVKSSEFYRTVKKARPLTDAEIVPTNLLLGERNYNSCYNFFLTLQKLKVTKKGREKLDRDDYRDYVTLYLIKALSDLGYTFNKARVPLDENKHFIMQGFCASKGGVDCRIYADKNEITLNFEVQYLEGNFHKVLNLHEKRTNRVCLILDPQLKPGTLHDEIEDYYNRMVDYRLQNKGFTNAFLILPYNDLPMEGAIVVSPFAENVDLSLKNMIRSCTIFAEGDINIYSHICPVCGAYVDGEQEDGNCYCPNCESVYTGLASGDNHKYTETIWIKRIKRPKRAL